MNSSISEQPSIPLSVLFSRLSRLASKESGRDYPKSIVGKPQWFTYLEIGQGYFQSELDIMTNPGGFKGTVKRSVSQDLMALAPFNITPNRLADTIDICSIYPEWSTRYSNMWKQGIVSTLLKLSTEEQDFSLFFQDDIGGVTILTAIVLSGLLTCSDSKFESVYQATWRGGISRSLAKTQGTDRIKIETPVTSNVESFLI